MHVLWFQLGKLQLSLIRISLLLLLNCTWTSSTHLAFVIYFDKLSVIESGLLRLMIWRYEKNVFKRIRSKYFSRNVKIISNVTLNLNTTYLKKIPDTSKSVIKKSYIFKLLIVHYFNFILFIHPRKDILLEYTFLKINQYSSHKKIVAKDIIGLFLEGFN